MISSKFLWPLSAVAGLLAIAAFVVIIHDTTQRRAAAQVITQATANRLADLATARADLVAPRTPSPETARLIFAPILAAAPDSAPLVTLDSVSLSVTAADGSRIFGAPPPARRFRAAAPLKGSLAGWTLTLSLAPHQFSNTIVGFTGLTRLWESGALLLMALVLVVLAVRASSRETQLARTRADFIAGTSHDLRMPLAQILLAGETLSLARTEEGERAALESTIVRESRRMIALVENVLLFSRSGAPDLAVTPRPVVVVELFANTCDSVHLAVEDAGQSISFALAAGLTLLGDRQLIRQALVNLIDNAIKYGPAKQRIMVGAERQHDKIMLTVEDKGPGVPESERDVVFEAYERLSRDRRSERAGSGLGLAIVRRIANACGGRAWIENAPGGGARAILEFPAAP